MSQSVSLPTVLAQVELPAGIEPFQVRDWISAIIEIGLLTWLFYVVLRFLHGTRGLAVLKGTGFTLALVMAILGTLEYVFGLSFPRLSVAGGVLVPFIGVVLVILFQPELRTGFTRLGAFGTLARNEAPQQLAEFTASIQKLSRRRTGALVVFEQQTGLGNFAATGVPLDASLAGSMIESIFFPNGPLHDGAIIVREGRIVAASCMLPLSESTSVSRRHGTRHRAALGVTEETDAVAVVVSEETGQVTVAHRGFLHTVQGSDSLLVTLADFLQGYEVELATT